MKRDWAVSIGSGLIVAIISTIAAWSVRSMLDLGSLWRRYWPVAVGVLVGTLWLGGYWLWRQWTLQERVSRLEEWKRQGAPDELGDITERALRSMIDPRSGGMDVKQ